MMSTSLTFQQRSASFRSAIWLFGLMWATPSFAAGLFEPKPADVCSKSRSTPGVVVLDARKLVAQLLEKNAGISSIDLDTTGSGVVFPATARALLDPETFCSSSQCSKKAQTSLGVAFIELKNFVDRHASRAQTPPFIDTSGIAGGSDPLRQFLLGNARSESVCFFPAPASPPASADIPPESTVKIGGVPWADIPHYFSLRQNIEDLPIPQDDDRFKGAKQASASWARDDIANRSSFGVNLAAGYTIGRLALDEDGRFLGQATSFLTYDHQFVEAATAAKNSRAQNIGLGAMADITLPAFVGYQNVQFFPKYTQSLSNNAQVLSGNFVYTPMFGIRGVDNIYYLLPELLSFQITPRFKAVVHDVLGVGTNPVLTNTGSYYWYGPQVNLAVFGEGALEGFTYTAAYEYYGISGGPLPHVSFFQTALNYDVGKSKLVSLQLKYQRGRNLDTLEPINQVTLGLGVKY